MFMCQSEDKKNVKLFYIGYCERDGYCILLPNKNRILLSSDLKFENGKMFVKKMELTVQCH